MDVLADVIAVSRLTNATLCSASFKPPWGLEFQPANRTTFHIVRYGSCWLQSCEVSNPVHLNQGDLVLLTRGSGHVLVDSPATSKEHHQQYGKIRSWCEPDVHATSLFCGGYTFEFDEFNPITSQLPPIVHIRSNEIKDSKELRSVLQLLMYESSESAPGAGTVVSRLIDILLVYSIRVWLSAQPERSAGWMGALRDPKIGRVLALIHRSPHESWTVDSLARSVAMSRAAFSKKFTDLTHQTPVAYVRNWRMKLAARMLRETRIPVGNIASQVGYDSETTFSRIFRKAFNIAPGQYRSRYLKTAEFK